MRGRGVQRVQVSKGDHHGQHTPAHPCLIRRLPGRTDGVFFRCSLSLSHAHVLTPCLHHRPVAQARCVLGQLRHARLDGQSSRLLLVNKVQPLLGRGGD